MFVVKGRRVTLIMAAGRSIKAAAFMHDETGKSFPREAVICGPYHHAGKKLEDGGSIEDEQGVHKPDKRTWDYFGDGYALKGGYVEVPGSVADAKRLSTWKYVGDTVEIRYARMGKYAEKHGYYHLFSRAVRVYKKGSAYRLELGRGCKINWRGFQSP